MTINLHIQKYNYIYRVSHDNQSTCLSIHIRYKHAPILRQHTFYLWKGYTVCFVWRFVS